MANGNSYVCADNDTSAGELIWSRPGGLPAFASTRHERAFAVRKPRMHTFISAALDRTDRLVAVH